MANGEESSNLKFEITGEHGTGTLRVVIPWFKGSPAWRGEPAHLIGTLTGVPYWTNKRLGLYSENGGPDKERPFAILDAPEDGFDDVPMGTTGEIRFHDGKRGKWKKVEPKEKPPGSTTSEWPTGF